MGDTIIIIGEKIKSIRTKKNIKLIKAAESAGISKGLLSKIENGRTVPSLPVLLQIIDALKVDLGDFFDDVKSRSETPPYLLIRKEDYREVKKDGAIGFNYFSIFQKTISTSTFHANLLELEMNAKRDMVITDGLEFIYLISGRIDYVLGDEEFTMEEGDSLFFDGRIPHLKLNHYAQKAKILVIYFLTQETKY